VQRKRELVDVAIEAICRRGAAQPQQDRAAADELTSELRKRAQNLFETWLSLVQSSTTESAKRRYSKFDRDKTGGPPLLFTSLDKDAPPQGSPESRFRAPTSMRDVEEVAHLWLKPKLGAYEPTGTKGGS